MKSKKKAPLVAPEVHILGDMDDVMTLIRILNKKKTVVIFRDPVAGAHYAEIDGDVELFPPEMIASLEKEYRFVYFDFFPARKKSPEEEPAAIEALPEEEAKSSKPEGISKKPVAKKVPKKKPVKKTSKTKK